MILCSACLLGIECCYDGRSRLNLKAVDLASRETLIPVCPEQLGGLPTPRSPSEIKEGRVFTKEGADVTAHFIRGAQEVLKIAGIYGITRALMKQRSPSCGCGEIYDGTFTGRVITGNGVTAELLMKHGINIITEDDF